MKSEQELIDLAEAYVRGELSPAEAAEFERLRRTDSGMDQKVVAHFNLMKQLSEYADYQQLRSELEDIHADIDVAGIRNEVLPKQVVIKRLWAKHRFNVGIAASVALFTLLSTLTFMGYFSKNVPTNGDYNSLARKVNQQLNQQNRKIETIARGENHGPANPGQFEGTGFAVSSDYLMTNYHIVRNADSVYVQNIKGDAYKARVVYTNPDYDVAVLQIVDPSFKPFLSLPYMIKRSSSDPAEDVFTVGFPGDKQVYNKGYLSSATGYDDDTTSYQASITVNPGNSGSPLFDNRGNVIGIIKGNQLRVDGVVFATKSNFLLKTISEIPADSLNGKISLSKKSKLAGLKRSEQVKKMGKYIFMVKAY
jgi:S1-C subfamily serine protease